MVEFKITWQTFWTPLTEPENSFWPPHKKDENFWTLFNSKDPLIIKQLRNFSTPSKEIYDFLNPLKQFSKIFWPPLPLDHPPYCWVKNDQPLIQGGVEILIMVTVDWDNTDGIRTLKEKVESVNFPPRRWRRRIQGRFKRNFEIYRRRRSRRKWQWL